MADEGGRARRGSGLSLTSNQHEIAKSYASAVNSKPMSLDYNEYVDANETCTLNRERTCFLSVNNKGERQEMYMKVVCACDESFGSQNIECIQQVSMNRFHVTFTSVALAQEAEGKGIKIDQEIIPMKQLGRPTITVHVKYAPFEMTNEQLGGLFVQYGTVKSIAHVYLSGKFSHISTGDRKLEIIMKNEIPNVIKFGQFTLVITYKGVKKLCKICGSTDHLARECDRVRRCTDCGQTGHNKNNCRVCFICNQWMKEPHTCTEVDVSAESLQEEHEKSNHNYVSTEEVQCETVDSFEYGNKRSNSEGRKELPPPFQRGDKIQRSPKKLISDGKGNQAGNSEQHKDVIYGNEEAPGKSRDNRGIKRGAKKK